MNALTKQEQLEVQEFSYLATLCATFIASKDSLKTRKEYTRNLKAFFTWCEASIRHPRDITVDTVWMYKEFLRSEGKALSTVAAYIASIRSFLDHCVQQRLVDFNAAQSVRCKAPKIQKQAPALTFSESQDMIGSCNTHAVSGLTERMLMIMMFNMGLRAEEVRTLKLKNFTRHDGTRVLKFKAKGDINDDSMIILNESVQNELHLYLQEFKRLTKEELASEDYLFQTQWYHKRRLNKQREVPSYNWVNDSLKAIAARVGITKNVTSHSCRVTAINYLLDELEMPIRDVSVFARHANISTTEKYDRKLKGLKGNPTLKLRF
jgi:site-specific recombinase XerD